MRIASVLAYFDVASLASLSAPIMRRADPLLIVGNDEKVSWDAKGNTILAASGKDSVVILDLADPEAPKIVANLPLKNSVVGLALVDLFAQYARARLRSPSATSS